jgi:hypothetical protein
MSSTEAPFSLALRAAPSSNRSRVLRSSAIASKEPKDNSVFSARRRREREDAEQIGGNVSGALDATGCNIGVYYDNAHTGNVTGANIHSENYYGVVVNGDVGAVAVNVTGSAIHRRESAHRTREPARERRLRSRLRRYGERHDLRQHATTRSAASATRR